MPTGWRKRDSWNYKDGLPMYYYSKMHVFINRHGLRNVYILLTCHNSIFSFLKKHFFLFAISYRNKNVDLSLKAKCDICIVSPQTYSDTSYSCQLLAPIQLMPKGEKHVFHSLCSGVVWGGNLVGSNHSRGNLTGTCSR